MMEIVLDTNVLVSGLIKAFGPPGRIIDVVRAGEVSLCVDDRILQEYADVLRRPELSPWIHQPDRDAILDFIAGYSRRVVATVLVEDLPDPGDSPFLEVALAADVPLVTGNIKHFPAALCRGAAVLLPADFVKTIGAAESWRR